MDCSNPGCATLSIRQGKIKIYPDVIKRMISSYTGA